MSKTNGNTKPAVGTLVAKPKPADQSIDRFIETALSTKASPETLERLFALQEKANAQRAKAAFVQALADFQNDCPIIEKKKRVFNKDGKTVRYQYAPLDVIIGEIKAPLAKHGLSYRWETKQEPGLMTAIATITHINGHSETSEFQVPIDKDSYMNAPQQYASALTFAKRYSLCNALGISTGDEDNDATTVNKEADAKNPKAKIVFLMRRLGQEPKTAAEFEEAAKKLTQLDLKAENYQEIIGRLEVLVSEREEYEKSNV